MAAAASPIPGRASGYQPGRPAVVSELVGGRVFSTSFESVNDFAGFYIVPQNYLGTTSHELSTEQVHSGTYSPKGWIYGANPPSTPTINNSHRDYPTLQLYKTAGGAFVCPCEVTLHVWLDMPLDVPGEWFSFATCTSDATDDWTPVFGVNVSAANPAPGTAPDGVVHLMHVPNPGETRADVSDQHHPLSHEAVGRAQVLPGHGSGSRRGEGVAGRTTRLDRLVNGGNGKLAQAHFGMYAAPEFASGVVYNDDLEIREVAAPSVGGIAEAPATGDAPAIRSAEASPVGREVILAMGATAAMLIGGGMFYWRRRRIR